MAYTDNDGSDQTASMCSLIRAFALRIIVFLLNLMPSAPVAIEYIREEQRRDQNVHFIHFYYVLMRVNQFADAQADLSLRYAYMSGGTFAHVDTRV